jgi:hypothetical protein
MLLPSSGLKCVDSGNASVIQAGSPLDPREGVRKRNLI